MIVGGIYLTLNERIYLYHYSVLRKVLAIYSRGYLKSECPPWLSLEKGRETELFRNQLEKLVEIYKPSLVNFVECGESVEEAREFIETLKGINVDSGASLPASLLMKASDLIPKVNYMSAYMNMSQIISGELSKDELFRVISALDNVELQIGVGSSSEYVEALQLSEAIDARIPVHIFIQKPISSGRAFSQEPRVNLYVHDLSTGSAEISETRCPNCSSLVIIRNGMLPLKGMAHISSRCPKCGTRVLYREPTNKWINANLLLKGVDIIPPGVQINYE